MGNCEMVSNEGLKQVYFHEAINQYCLGRTIECRIYDSFGQIIEWEKYNKCQGLEIALEFNEIINGKWFVHLNDY